jgi:uncharacterized membrane protein
MEENAKIVESLIEKTTEFAKSSFELVKLKTIDKTADVVSTLIPHAVVLIFIVSFILFLNLGIALWLGEILGETFYGFFVLAGFYAVAATVFHFFFHDKMKEGIGNYIVKQLLK